MSRFSGGGLSSKEKGSVSKDRPRRSLTSTCEFLECADDDSLSRDTVVKSLEGVPSLPAFSAPETRPSDWSKLSNIDRLRYSLSLGDKKEGGKFTFKEVLELLGISEDEMLLGSKMHEILNTLFQERVASIYLYTILCRHIACDLEGRHCHGKLFKDFLIQKLPGGFEWFAESQKTQKMEIFDTIESLKEARDIRLLWASELVTESLQNAMLLYEMAGLSGVFVKDIQDIMLLCRCYDVLRSVDGEKRWQDFALMGTETMEEEFAEKDNLREAYLLLTWIRALYSLLASKTFDVSKISERECEEVARGVVAVFGQSDSLFARDLIAVFRLFLLGKARVEINMDRLDHVSFFERLSHAIHICGGDECKYLLEFLCDGVMVDPEVLYKGCELSTAPWYPVLESALFKTGQIRFFDAPKRALFVDRLFVEWKSVYSLDGDTKTCERVTNAFVPFCEHPDVGVRVWSDVIVPIFVSVSEHVWVHPGVANAALNVVAKLISRENSDEMFARIEEDLRKKVGAVSIVDLLFDWCEISFDAFAPEDVSGRVVSVLRCATALVLDDSSMKDVILGQGSPLVGIVRMCNMSWDSVVLTTFSEEEKLDVLDTLSRFCLAALSGTVCHVDRELWNLFISLSTALDRFRSVHVMYNVGLLVWFTSILERSLFVTATTPERYQQHQIGRLLRYVQFGCQSWVEDAMRGDRLSIRRYRDFSVFCVKRLAETLQFVLPSTVTKCRIAFEVELASFFHECFHLIRRLHDDAALLVIWEFLASFVSRNDFSSFKTFFAAKVFSKKVNSNLFVKALLSVLRRKKCNVSIVRFAVDAFCAFSRSNAGLLREINTKREKIIATAAEFVQRREQERVLGETQFVHVVAAVSRLFPILLDLQPLHLAPSKSSKDDGRGSVATNHIDELRTILEVASVIMKRCNDLCLVVPDGLELLGNVCRTLASVVHRPGSQNSELWVPIWKDFWLGGSSGERGLLASFCAPHENIIPALVGWMRPREVGIRCEIVNVVVRYIRHMTTLLHVVRSVRVEQEDENRAKQFLPIGIEMLPVLMSSGQELLPTPEQMILVETFVNHIVSVLHVAGDISVRDESFFTENESQNISFHLESFLFQLQRCSWCHEERCRLIRKRLFSIIMKLDCHGARRCLVRILDSDMMFSSKFDYSAIACDPAVMGLIKRNLEMPDISAQTFEEIVLFLIHVACGKGKETTLAVERVVDIGIVDAISKCSHISLEGSAMPVENDVDGAKNGNPGDNSAWLKNWVFTLCFVVGVIRETRESPKMSSVKSTIEEFVLRCEKRIMNGLVSNFRVRSVSNLQEMEQILLLLHLFVQRFGIPPFFWRHAQPLHEGMIMDGRFAIRNDDPDDTVVKNPTCIADALSRCLVLLSRMFREPLRNLGKHFSHEHMLPIQQDKGKKRKAVHFETVSGKDRRGGDDDGDDDVEEGLSVVPAPSERDHMLDLKDDSSIDDSDSPDGLVGRVRSSGFGRGIGSLEVSLAPLDVLPFVFIEPDRTKRSGQHGMHRVSSTLSSTSDVDDPDLSSSESAPGVSRVSGHQESMIDEQWVADATLFRSLYYILGILCSRSQAFSSPLVHVEMRAVHGYEHPFFMDASDVCLDLETFQVDISLLVDILRGCYNLIGNLAPAPDHFEHDSESRIMLISSFEMVLFLIVAHTMMSEGSDDSHSEDLRRHLWSMAERHARDLMSMLEKFLVSIDKIGESVEKGRKEYEKRLLLEDLGCIREAIHRLSRDSTRG
eukprot:TRINITY_DN3975_c0_g1_i1.p1 TRINITY_DN3975_c0_g1~~TRINITY_DN3975_c0_g1_i1.p1  ORF type:complete len:1746 (+),score=405.04 TRINITY_DN3975_c0_g1_i1:94-5331(+)